LPFRSPSRFATYKIRCQKDRQGHKCPCLAILKYILEKAGGDLHRVFEMLLAKGMIDETAMETKIASIVTKPQDLYRDNYFARKVEDFKTFDI
jgi:hypothetical protein